MVFIVFVPLLGGSEEVSEDPGGCLGRRWLEGCVFPKFLVMRGYALFFVQFREARKRCLSILGAVLDDVGSRVFVFLKFFGHVGDKRANNRGKMAT